MWTKSVWVKVLPADVRGQSLAELGMGDNARASFEISEEDLAALRSRIGAMSGPSASPCPPPPTQPSARASDPTFEAWRVRWRFSMHFWLTAFRRLTQPRPRPSQGKHPCALANFPKFVELLKGKRLAVFLDYDGAASMPSLTPVPLTSLFCLPSGTLTPIVPNPEDAVLSDQVGPCMCPWMLHG